MDKLNIDFKSITFLPEPEKFSYETVYDITKRLWVDKYPLYNIKINYTEFEDDIANIYLVYCIDTIYTQPFYMADIAKIPLPKQYIEIASRIFNIDNNKASQLKLYVISDTFMCKCLVDKIEISWIEYLKNN
jgi:hypothetical protein